MSISIDIDISIDIYSQCQRCETVLAACCFFLQVTEDNTEMLSGLSNFTV